jgi:hypothetical protein
MITIMVVVVVVVMKYHRVNKDAYRHIPNGDTTTRQNINPISIFTRHNYILLQKTTDRPACCVFLVSHHRAVQAYKSVMQNSTIKL